VGVSARSGTGSIQKPQPRSFRSTRGPTTHGSGKAGTDSSPLPRERHASQMENAGTGTGAVVPPHRGIKLTKCLLLTRVSEGPRLHDCVHCIDEGWWQRYRGWKEDSSPLRAASTSWEGRELQGTSGPRFRFRIFLGCHLRCWDWLSLPANSTRRPRSLTKTQPAAGATSHNARAPELGNYSIPLTARNHSFSSI
jgi:hypothetical protein